MISSIATTFVLSKVPESETPTRAAPSSRSPSRGNKG